MKSFILSSLLFMGSLNAQAPQQVPQQIPPVIPPPPPVNNNPAALNPANPQAPVNPGPPVQQVTPQQPPQYGAPATQQQTPGYNPYNPYNPYQQQPGFGGGFMPQIPVDPQQLNCEFGQCRNRRMVVAPAQRFNLQCQEPFLCDNLDLTLNVPLDVTRIDGLTFSAPTRNVKVTINTGYNVDVEINNIRCEVFGACNGLTITTGFGVDITNINVDCQEPGACNGCTINRMPCDMLSAQQGNSQAGYNPYNQYSNYGYQQYGAPQYGAPPQQPGFGAPQQPPQGPPVYPGVQQPQAPQLPTYPQPPAMPQQGVPQYPQYRV